MSNFVIYVLKHVWKRKNLWTRDSTGILHISVYSESNVKLHTGWSIFLFHLSENKCSEQILENFRNGKIFRRQNFFVGIIRR